jgi:hypothetical protein
MNDKLSKALDIANYMVTLANEKKIILEEYKQNLIYFVNGHTFFVSKELINFVKTLIDLGQTDAVILDDNNIPVDIENLAQFLETLLSVYTSSVNQYQTKYQSLKNNRSVESILEL